MSSDQIHALFGMVAGQSIAIIFGVFKVVWWVSKMEFRLEKCEGDLKIYFDKLRSDQKEKTV